MGRTNKMEAAGRAAVRSGATGYSYIRPLQGYRPLFLRQGRVFALARPQVCVCVCDSRDIIVDLVVDLVQSFKVIAFLT